MNENIQQLLDISSQLATLAVNLTDSSKTLSKTKTYVREIGNLSFDLKNLHYKLTKECE